MRALLASMGLCLLLSACILVGDFGPYWEKAIRDPQLVGMWEHDGGGRLLFTSDEARRAYRMQSFRGTWDKRGSQNTVLARSLVLGDATFLLLQSEDDAPGGEMYRYRIEHGVLTFYYPKEAFREAFKREYPTEAVRLKETSVQVPVLNEEAVRILTEIGNTNYWWLESKHYVRPKPVAKKDGESSDE